MPNLLLHRFGYSEFETTAKGLKNHPTLSGEQLEEHRSALTELFLDGSKMRAAQRFYNPDIVFPTEKTSWSTFLGAFGGSEEAAFEALSQQKEFLVLDFRNESPSDQMRLSDKLAGIPNVQGIVHIDISKFYEHLISEKLFDLEAMTIHRASDANQTKFIAEMEKRKNILFFFSLHSIEENGEDGAHKADLFRVLDSDVMMDHCKNVVWVSDDLDATLADRAQEQVGSYWSNSQVYPITPLLCVDSISGGRDRFYGVSPVAMKIRKQLESLWGGELLDPIEFRKAENSDKLRQLVEVTEREIFRIITTRLHPNKVPLAAFGRYEDVMEIPDLQKASYVISTGIFAVIQRPHYLDAARSNFSLHAGIAIRDVYNDHIQRTQYQRSYPFDGNTMVKKIQRTLQREWDDIGGETPTTGYHFTWELNF